MSRKLSAASTPDDSPEARPGQQTVSAKPEAVARWMLQELERNQQLGQVEAVLGIAARFGTSYLNQNRNGRPAIDKRVLKAFKALSASTVVWDRADFCWRERQAGASPARDERSG
jgi:hypothetical protein